MTALEMIMSLHDRLDEAINDGDHVRALQMSTWITEVRESLSPATLAAYEEWIREYFEM